MPSSTTSAGDIAAREDEPEEDGAEAEEGEAGSEAVSGALWRHYLAPLQGRGVCPGGGTTTRP